MGNDTLDQARLKKFRLRIDTDDPIYKGMKKLKVRGRDLGHLPPEVCHLIELEVLDLSPERESCINYRLRDVPLGIGRLINLRVLMLDTNGIEEVPAILGLLKGLERLSLSNNLLTSLPDNMTGLKMLTSLHLSNNELTEFPQILCELTELEFLDLCDNAIEKLPDQISNLVKLESLLLFINQLSELPDSLCSMVSLRCLWLANNRLRKLPRNFGNLQLLDWGGLSHTSSAVINDNPLQEPPMEVCKRGVVAIADYFNVLDQGRHGSRNPPGKTDTSRSQPRPSDHHTQGAEGDDHGRRRR